MDELLDQLKSRITALLSKQGQLLQEQSEKKLLQEKHQHAISQIEKMIARLKLLEKSQP